MLYNGEPVTTKSLPEYGKVQMVAVPMVVVSVLVVCGAWSQ